MVNLAFILQSFGVKMSPEEIENATNAIKTLPALLQDWKARFDEMEKRNIETHAMLCALTADNAKAQVREFMARSHVDREHERQVFLFPPDDTFLIAAQQMEGRMQHDNRNENGNVGSQNAGSLGNCVK